MKNNDTNIRNLSIIISGLLASGHYTTLDEDGRPVVKFEVDELGKNPHPLVVSDAFDILERTVELAKIVREGMEAEEAEI